MLEKVQKIIMTQLNLKKEQVKPETKLLEELNADSLDMIEIITEIENEFGISISDDDIFKLKTVNDVVEYVQNKKK